MKPILIILLVFLSKWFYCDGQKAAFFIGIGNYKIMPPLDNCARDADSMKEALHRIGYDTFEIKNASNAEVRSALVQWFPLMAKYRDVVIYFSGHGFMLASNNEFMALNDFNPNNFKDVESRTIHKFYLMDMLSHLNSTPTSFPQNKIIIIDACRSFPERGDIKKILDKLSLDEPPLLQYKVWYSVQAGGTSFADGPHNTVATAALLSQLTDNPYLGQETFFNEVNGKLQNIPHNQIYFKEDGAPFDWSFSAPKPGHGFAPPIVPNTQICFNCEPNHFSEVRDMLGVDTKFLFKEGNLLQRDRVKLGLDTIETFVGDFENSTIEKKMDFEFQKFDISSKLIDPRRSFVVYEFSKEKLATLQIYLKYRDPELHSRLASALGVNLNRFPGFCYLSSISEAEAIGQDPKADAFPILFGRVVKYGYTILEIGPGPELFGDSQGISKFTGVFSVLRIPEWSDLR